TPRCVLAATLRRAPLLKHHPAPLVQRSTPPVSALRLHGAVYGSCWPESAIGRLLPDVASASARQEPPCTPNQKRPAGLLSASPVPQERRTCTAPRHIIP